MENTATIYDLLDRPIAFQRVFVTLAGSVTAALMLSQAVYWQKRTKSEDGWFYKTIDEWQEETGLTRYEQDAARKKLKKYLQSNLRGVPARLYFKVDETALLADLFVEKPQTGLGKNPKLVSGFSPNINRNSETTTETTTQASADEFASSENPDLPPVQIANFPAELRMPLTWFWELFRVPVPKGRKGREYDRWKEGIIALTEIADRHGRLAFERAHSEWKRLGFQVGNPGALENTMRAVVGDLERQEMVRLPNIPVETPVERTPEERADLQRQAEAARQRLEERWKKNTKTTQIKKDKP
jgi:hypothetical protein